MAKTQGEENAKKFLEALEKDENLKKEFSEKLNLEQSLIKLQQEFRPDLPFEAGDLEKALEGLWGDICERVKLCIPVCFSEVPGY